MHIVDINEVEENLDELIEKCQNETVGISVKGITKFVMISTEEYERLFNSPLLKEALKERELTKP